MKKLIIIISISFILFLSLGSIQASSDIDANLTSDGDGPKTFDVIQSEIVSSNESGVIVLDGTYSGSSKPIVIDKPLTVRGADGAKLDGQSKTQILQITSDNVVLENLMFANGAISSTAAIDSGGAIYATGNNIRIVNCTFVSNSASYGGAIQSSGDNVSVIGCKFSYNKAETSGGAMELIGEGNYAENCQFEYNSGYHAGGDVSWIGSNGTLANSTFYECGDSKYPSQFGGAVVWIGSNGKLTQSTFVKKSARKYGAAVYWRGDNGSMTYCIFSNCISPNDNAYWGNPDYAQCDYWGMNINSSEDFTQAKMAYYDGAFAAPENWANVAETDEWVNFTSNDGSKLDAALPDWSVNGNVISGNSFKIKTATSIACKTPTVYNGKYVQIALKDANGKSLVSKTLKVNFNGKSYNVVTNANGIGTLWVDVKNAGTYNANIVFNGDKDFKPSSLLCKITVKKQKPTLTVATKSLKLKSKKKIVKVYLKDASKKAISKRTLKLTINKKVYTAKTNSKGLASFKVTLKAKKNYSAVFKFAGDKYYNSVKKSAKIRVK